MEAPEGLGRGVVGCSAVLAVLIVASVEPDVFVTARFAALHHLGGEEVCHLAPRGQLEL